VLEDRCFGSDPAFVSSCGRAYIQGLQNGGVWACAKHFPGHGTVSGDSHKLLPVSGLGQAALESHLEPFRAAVAAGVRVMMAAHLHFPGIDGRPVPFSPYFLRSLARSEIGFTGLLLSDDLDMAAVTDRPLPEVMVAALNAGLDMALWGRNLRPVADPLPVMEKFVAGLQNCALSEAALRRRLKRLDLLLKHFTS
jgi:beta-N-acetylhexosaminidase